MLSRWYKIKGQAAIGHTISGGISPCWRRASFFGKSLSSPFRQWGAKAQAAPLKGGVIVSKKLVSRTDTLYEVQHPRLKAVQLACPSSGNLQNELGSFVMGNSPSNPVIIPLLQMVYFLCHVRR